LIEQMEADNAPNVVVSESADPEFFIAHYDMSRAAETPVTPGPNGLPPWVDFTTRMAACSVITIASVRDRARGVGNEFLLACDMRFASLERAVFG
jgi:enoyl-CoA hydratase/carnithine racemase